MDKQASSPGHLVANDSNRFVTPYAFQVADHLLGTPLAHPAKRLLALFLDFCFVALLTSMSSTLWFGALAWVFLKMSRNLKDKEPENVGFLQRKSRWLGWCMLFGFALSILTTPIEETLTFDTEMFFSASVNSALSNDSTDIEEQNVIEVVPFFRELFKSFGLSFGFGVLYFTVLTSRFYGQTLGKYLVGISVVKFNGSYLTLWESFGRYGGYGAGLVTGLLGFAQILWDNNRQAIQDKIAETLVIDLRGEKVVLAQDGQRL